MIRRRKLFRDVVVCAFLIFFAQMGRAAAEEGPVYGPELEGFDYPKPVQRFKFHSQAQSVQMAYMDIIASKPNGRTVVLLHGKNFCAATWEGTIMALSTAGYRVIAPDQIGFCKSTKPRHYHILSNNSLAIRRLCWNH